MAPATPANDRLSPMSFPLAWASAWSEAAGESLRASLTALKAYADACAEAQRAYVTMLSRSLSVEQGLPLAVMNATTNLFEAELAASERATEHLAYVAEEALSDSVGRMAPLPD